MITRPKIRNELRAFLATAAYLYTCYGLLILYKAVLLQDQGVDYAPYGLAAAKALLLAKFMLIGDKLHLGAQSRGRTVVHLIMRKSAFFFLLIIALSVVEDAVVGAIRGQSVRHTVDELVQGRLAEITVTSLLLFVILIPYFACREFDTMLGEGKLLEMLWRRQ